MSAAMLIDTDVLIWYLRGYPQAARFIDGVTDLRLSSITYMELIQGCRNRQEMAQIKKDLNRRKAKILPVAEAISNRAQSLVETFCFGNRLMLADALIAAMAAENDLVLVTANEKHFRVVPGLRVLKFEASV
jgi:predicted nucleic acid-binding protein